MEKTFKEIIESSKLTLVDFYADWCAPCKVMSGILDDIKEEISKDVDIFKVDVEEDIELAKELQIRSIPTILFYKNGKQLVRKNGILKLEELKEIIDTYK